MPTRTPDEAQWVEVGFLTPVQGVRGVGAEGLSAVFVPIFVAVATVAVLVVVAGVGLAGVKG